MPVRPFLLFLLFLIGMSFGDDPKDETLLGSGAIRSSGFGGPAVKFCRLNDQDGIFVGARGGWLINSSFSIGGGGYGLANRVHSDHPDSARLDLGYGGLILEAIYLPYKLVHGTASVLIGAGSASIPQRTGTDRENSDTFFALEPELSLEVNIVRFFRICPGISYRWLAGDSRLLDSDRDISGFAGSLTFKFGKF